MLSKPGMGARGSVRATISCLALLGGLILLPKTAAADHSGSEATQAAKEIQAARDRANDAAQAMFDAESEIEVLDLEIAGSEAQVAELEAQIGSMQTTLQAIAVRRFTSNSGAGNPIIMSFDDMSSAAAFNYYSGVASGEVVTSLDEYDAVLSDLEDAQDRLEQQRHDAESARATFESLRAKAEAQISTLQALERQRVADANVQHELDRLRREREAKERREQAAKAAEEATQAAAAVNNVPSPPRTPQPTPQPPSVPAPRAGIVCPVAGPMGFSDTWGARRSGGRTHEGVDMMAAPGTPLVAVESGYALFKTSPLGGNSIWLTGGSGTKYFYAHLSAWEGASRNVSQGEVIGYVGSTGNTSVNHLHFEVHPGGGAAVNPYPYVRAVC